MAAIVPEKTTSYLTVSFFDKNGLPVTPTTVTWRAIDVGTGNVLKTETSITPGTAVEIAIGATVNLIVTAANEEETRRIIIHATYGTSDELNDQYDYIVKNLSVIT